MQADRMCFVRPNPGRTSPRALAALLWFVASGLVGNAAQAQAAAPVPATAIPVTSAATAASATLKAVPPPVELAETPAPDKSGQRIQRIHVEDSGSSIDELRYGGETRSVTVQPKYDVPAYEIRPTNGARQSQTADTAASPRVWNLLNF